MKEFERYIPVPACTVDEEGKISEVNCHIGNVFVYDGIEGADVFTLTGVKYETFQEAAEKGEKIKLSRNDRVFDMAPVMTEDGLYIYFMDVTGFTELEETYEREKICMAVVNIDNYDEINLGTAAEKQMSMATTIDGIIRQWAAAMTASVIKQNSACYNIVMSMEMCRQQMDERFPILDRIREIESSVEFPITLSIGVGINGATPEENFELAQQALDLAKGRGGDQAVVRDGEEIYYFGGKAQTVEKANKGKSRVIGYALKRLIESSSRVFIMGHKNPDMDAFGSAMGISRMAMPLNRETYIVLENYGEALDLLYREAKASENYNLIGRKKAIELINDKALVIVVDTHKPSIVECPELLESKAKTVVIDHHRKSEEALENPTLIYMEPYASSTAELVTEILQYTIERKELTKLEAEGLLAGIFVDTNNFSVKAGVRTFEAAAWLRRAGADLYNVKRLFQVEKKICMSKAYGIYNAEFTEDGAAFSKCITEDQDTQMICSQIADELITIRGIRMSFVVGKDHNGRTVVSARSVGEVNVQVIMEAFGGGGHLNAAGTQTDEPPQEVIEKIKEMVREEQ